MEACAITLLVSDPISYYMTAKNMCLLNAVRLERNYMCQYNIFIQPDRYRHD